MATVPTGPRSSSGCPTSSTGSVSKPNVKPVEWISSLLQRYEEQLPTRTGVPMSGQAEQLLASSQACLINVSKHHFYLVIGGLIKVLKAVNSSRSTSEAALMQSRMFVMTAVEDCMNEFSPGVARRNIERETCLKNLLDEMCQLLQLHTDDAMSAEVKERAAAVVYSLSAVSFAAVFARFTSAIAIIAVDGESTADMATVVADIELIQHVHIDKENVTKVIKEITQRWPFKKDNLDLVCGVVSAVIWSWIDAYPEEFSTLQHTPEDELTDYCDKLFNQLDTMSSELKRRCGAWPLQMLLLAVGPSSLEAVTHAEVDAINAPAKTLRKKQFLDLIKSTLSSAAAASGSRAQWTPQLTYACVAGVYLCKCATYVNLSDFFANVVFNVVQQIIDDLKILLFTGARTWTSRAGSEMETDVLVDCFVALYRLRYDNEVFRVCLCPYSLLQLVLVAGLYRISVQPRLRWWPKIDMVISRADELRTLFADVLHRVLSHATPTAAVGGHLPISVTRSWHKLSGKSKDRIVGNTFEDSTDRLLLSCMVRLICVEPTLLIRERPLSQHDVKQGGREAMPTEPPEPRSCPAADVISGLVLLMGSVEIPTDLRLGAMDALLCVNRPDVVRFWNIDSKYMCMATFWYIGSQLIFSVCQKLLHFQLGNSADVLRWLRSLMQHRKAFLLSNKKYAAYGSNEQISKQAAVKLEAVCFFYLWSLNADAVLTALSLFASMREQTDAVGSHDEIPVEYAVYTHLSNAKNILTAGRIALQKTLNPYLRQLPNATEGCFQAWDETLRVWEAFTCYLTSPSRSVCEHADYVEDLTRIIGGHVSTSRGTEHERETQMHSTIVDLWANMTGFLCSVGGVCYTDRESCCSVNSFIGRALSLLRTVIPSAFKVQVTKNIKELLSYELSRKLDRCLFQEIQSLTDRLTDTSGNEIINRTNTEFVEHVIYIVRNVIVKRSHHVSHGERGIDSAILQSVLSSLASYVRRLDEKDRGQNLTVVTKLCALLEQVFSSHKHLAVDADMKLRYEVAEHITTWMSVSWSLAEKHQSSNDLIDMYNTQRNFDLAVVSALTNVLNNLPLRSERSGVAASFQRIFDLLVAALARAGRGAGLPLGSTTPNLAEDRASVSSDTLHMQMNEQPTESAGLEGVTESSAGASIAAYSTTAPASDKAISEKMTIAVLNAMVNLLAANSDVGMTKVIDAAWHRDVHVRTAIVQVITRMLRRDGRRERATVAHMADENDELIKLMTVITDDGVLPLVSALAKCVTNQHLDKLARVAVTTFAEKHLLYELMWTVFSKEADAAVSATTLFRGSTLGAKIMLHCFRVFGHAYLLNTLRPFITQLLSTPDKTYEIDPTRLEEGEDVKQNEANVEALTARAFEAIMRSQDRFPQQLRSLCHCLYQTINARFPGSGLASVEKILFLRFFNPAIVAPYESSLTEIQLNSNMKRAVTIVSKILQSIANRPSFVKEQLLVPFKDFISSRIEPAKKFVSNVALNDSSVSSLESAILRPAINPPLLFSVHSLLWSHREQIARQLSLNSAHSNLCSRLTAVLDDLGSPSRQVFREADDDVRVDTRVTSIFFYLGHDRTGFPAYALIWRRYRKNLIDIEGLTAHILQALRSYQTGERPYVIVVDALFVTAENNLPTALLSTRLSATVVHNLHRLYIINCNSYTYDTIKNDDWFGMLQSMGKLQMVNSLIDLLNLIPDAIDRLPAVTISFGEDVANLQVDCTLMNAMDSHCVARVGREHMLLTLNRYWDGRLLAVTDTYPAAHMEEIYLINTRMVTITLRHEASPLSLYTKDARAFFESLITLRAQTRSTASARFGSGQTCRRSRDNLGALLNLVMVNLCHPDANLRSTAYCLLYELANTFDLPVKDQLMEPGCVCVSANSARFMKNLSLTVATGEPSLAVSMVDSALDGLDRAPDLARPLLDCLGPWWAALVDVHERDKPAVVALLEKLIRSTLFDSALRPWLIDKAWPNIGSLPGLVDVAVGCLTEAMRAGRATEAVAEVVVAISDGGPAMGACVVSRLIALLDATAHSPHKTDLEDEACWPEFQCLTSFALALSFDGRLDVVSNLPKLLHIVTCVAGLGSAAFRASIYCIVSNIFHSFGSDERTRLSDAAKRSLSFFLRQLTNRRGMELFDVGRFDCVQSAVAAAMTISAPFEAHRQRSITYTMADLKYSQQDREPSVSVDLARIKALDSLLIGIVADLEKELEGREWLAEWRQLAKTAAFRLAANLQLRSLTAFSCLAKTASEGDMKAVVAMLVQAIKRREEPATIGALAMALVRLQTIVAQNSPIHRVMFWLVISIFQLEHLSLYAHALDLLESNLQMLDRLGMFDHSTLETLAMDARKPMEWEFKALDQQSGLSFRSNFSFALVGYLLKGLREPTQTVRVVEVLHLLLRITAKPHGHNPYCLTIENIPYLLALLPFSEKVQKRCRLRYPQPSLNASTATPGVDDDALGEAAEKTKSLESLQEEPTPMGAMGGAALPSHSTVSGFPSPRRWFGNEHGQSAVDRQASHILTLPRRGRLTATTPRSQSFPASLVDAPLRAAHGDAHHTPTIAVWEVSGEDLTDNRLDETAILLDANILRTEDTQALTVAVLAILIRSSPTTADVQILFDYILEAITVFPRVLPVIHSFVDQRIVSLLHSCHSPSLLQAVLRVVESTVVNKEEGQDEAMGQHQHVSTYLQQRGFGGLWRYAGSFLNDTASRQAVTPDLCACLERILGSI